MNIKNNKQIYIQLNSSKRIKIEELMYMLALSIYLIGVMLDTTMFRVYLDYKIITFINIAVSFIIILKIIMFDKYSLNKFILMLILFIVSILAYLKSGYENLFYLPILVIGAKNIEFKKICKVYLIVGVTIVILAMIATKLNIIEDIIYFRNGMPRYSFGSVYATDFAARIFFLSITYCYIKYDRLNILDSIVFIILGGFTSYYCDARLDSISIFILSILPFIVRKITKNKKNISKIKKFLLVVSIPAFATISIVVTNIYNPNNIITVWLNNILSNRLKFGKQGLEQYGLSPFGQVVKMHGFGANSGVVKEYFFIDCSYLHIALRYGIILLLIICIYYSIFIKFRLDNKDIFLPILIIIIGINSIVAHHFLDIAYNPFILILFSNMSNIAKKVNNYNSNLFYRKNINKAKIEKSLDLERR